MSMSIVAQAQVVYPGLPARYYTFHPESIITGKAMIPGYNNVPSTTVISRLHLPIPNQSAPYPSLRSASILSAASFCNAGITWE